MKKNQLYRSRAAFSGCSSCLLFIGLLVLSTFLYRCKKPELTGAGNPATAGLNAQAKNAAAAPQAPISTTTGMLLLVMPKWR